MRLMLMLAVLLVPWPARAVNVTLDAMIGECPELAQICTRQTPTPTPGPTPTPTPVPTPTPTPSPRWTSSPRPCEGLGVKTLEPGEWRTMCFDVPASAGPIIEIGSINLGNASCGSVLMHVYSPAGRKVCESVGAQPGCAWNKIVGKWYVDVMLQYGCANYKFTWKN